MSADPEQLSANRKLLLETLLKSRMDASGTVPPPSPERENPRRSNQDRTFYPGGGGEPADAGTAYDYRDREAAGLPGGWLRNLLLGHPLLKMARQLLEQSASTEEVWPEDIQRQSPLICMRAEGSRIPFFCVHALLGSAFHYFALANMLDEAQPFYALQAPGLDGAEPPLSRIEDFASYYLRFIRQIQPEGPYKIGGYSFGGLVAFEMARQLARAGEEVSHLIIFGTDIPVSVSNPALFKALDFFGQYATDFHRNLIKPFFSYEKRVNWNAGARKLPFSPTLVKVVMAHCLAALRYNPRPFPGKIILLETLEQQLLSPLDSSRGWDRLAVQDVETLVVSGNHLSMLDEPHIRDLAEKLNAVLDES